MAPPLSSDEEQSESERLEISRRYRERRGRELRELAEPHVDGEVSEAGEFSTAPLEALAAIPILGAFFALFVRLRAARRKLAPTVLVALDSDQLYLLGMRSEVEGPKTKLISSWPRADARVESVTPRFMREKVVVEIAGREPLNLYASSLRTNPWAAAIVRELGGEAPEPLDLSDSPSADQPRSG